MPERLVCHYCQHTESPHDTCPNCGAITLRQRGLGCEIVGGAEALRSMLDGGDSISNYFRIVMDREQEADNATREVLIAVRLVDAPTLHEHHGADPEQITGILEASGFVLRHHRRFELGLNHAFVFDRPAGPTH